MDRLLSQGVDAAPPELKAVIRLLDPACNAESCFEALRASPDIFDTARRQNVAGIVADRWMAQLAQAQSPAQMKRWHGLAFSAVAQQARDEREIADLLSGLANAGVVPVVMRGLWLSYALYPDPSLRPHSDIDLLFPVDRLNEAIRALQDLGYNSARSDSLPLDTELIRKRLRAGYQSPCGGAFRPATEDRRLTIDVHVDLHLVGQGWWPYGPTPEELFDRTSPWEILGAPARALHLPMAMLGLVENIARHAVAREGYGNWLVRLYDLLLVARSMNDRDWERLVEDARRFRLSLQVGIFLELTERLWGPHWPTETLDRLRKPTIAFKLARMAASRPAWLGHRGRAALLQAAATLTLPAAVVYVSRNALWSLNPQ